MKKFIFVFAALVVSLVGCQAQKSMNSAGIIRETRFAGASEEQTEPVEVAKADETDKSEPRAEPEPRRADARSEGKAEAEEAPPRKPRPPRAERPRLNAEQGKRGAEPRAEPEPRPEPRAEPVTPTIPMGPSGARGVVLRNPRTVTYRPAYAAWTAGYMFQFENNTSTFQWVSTTGYVTMLPLRGQCMESPRLPPVPNPEHCPFVELQTKTGSWVVLIKPGYKAMFVIDTETCPPDGSGCKTTIQAIPYSMEVEPRPARNRRKVRTFEFPRSPKGWRWFL